jgi:16S rRNA (cytidine1402-2'-O)-methyltransferase
LVGSLEDAAAVFGQRRACVARELTKIHEEAARGTLPELALLFRSRGTGRGEATVVVEGARGGEPVLSPPDTDREIAAGLAAGTPPRQLAREIARRSGRPAREIYARAIALAREVKREGQTAME